MREYMELKFKLIESSDIDLEKKAGSAQDEDSLKRLAEGLCEPDDNSKRMARKKNTAIKRLVMSLFKTAKVGA